MSKNFSGILLFFFIFVSISIIISSWVGYFWRNSYFIFISSLATTYIVYKKYPYDFEIPRNVYLLSLVMLLLTATPLVIITPYYTGSADALHTTIIRAIKDKIPDTYAPYSNLRLIYQLGFHLFAKMFTDFFAFIPDYLVLWFFGVIFSTIMVVLTYHFARTFFKNESYGEWTTLLLIGTKTPFQLMFWGVYPNILAIDLFLLCFALFIQNNKLAYLFFPATFIVHPVGALMLLFFIGIYCVYYHNLKRLLLLMSSMVLALPSILTTYAPFLTNMADPSTYEPVTASYLQRLITMIFPMPAWFGIVPFIFAVLSLFFVIKNRYFEREIRFVLSTILLSFMLYSVFYFSGSNHANKIFILVTFASLLLAAVLPSKFEMTKPQFSKIVIILLCIFTFLASSELTRLRGGSKITKDEVDFALVFKEFDPTLTETLFLSPGGAWMAHISNKIPYDVRSGWFVQYAVSQVIKDKGYEEMNQRHKKWEEIYNNKCVECIYKLNVTYAVINKNYFKSTLNETPVLQYKYFDVYRLK